jgi:hypothetical protein
VARAALRRAQGPAGSAGPACRGPYAWACGGRGDQHDRTRQGGRWPRRGASSRSRRSMVVASEPARPRRGQVDLSLPGRQRGAATRLRQRPHARRRAPPGETVRFSSSFPDTRRASTVAAGNPLLRPADVAFQDRAAARNASGSAARIRAEYRVHVRAGPWLSVIRLLVFANSREGEIASCGGFGSKHER